VPTGNRNTHRQIDTSSNCVLLDGQPVDISQPPQNFHQRMRTLAPRYGVDGHAHAQGVFSQAAGYNHGGNNHYAWENVRISGVQLRPDCVETQDRLVGARLALWGHYNDYLRTSFNRARWVELDPSRADAVQIYAGQMTLSAADADPNTPALFSADIGQPHAARWVQDQHIVERSSHILDREFGLVRQFQFSVAKHDPYFLFGAQSEAHPSLEALRLALEDRRVQGLTVQYALFNMSTPQQPDAPVFYDLSGCLGLWCEDELATWPTGRLLLSQQTGLGPVRLIVRADHVSLNMMTAIPFTHRAPQAQSRHQPTHALGGKLPLGELQVLTACGDVIARLPESLYLNYWQHHGVMDLPLLQPVADGGLRLQSVRAEWREEESEVQCETANLYLEAPDHQRGIDFPIAIPLYGAFRGRTAELDLALYVEQPERLALKHAPGDRFGQSTLTLTGLQPGITRVRFGASACAPLIHVRVLPDDWHLNDVPAAQVDYAFLYHHVLSYYELIYPFMSDKVFSLAERCKCETHARLMWQMCDPQNRDKSYYMPSTRELSQAKARLFLKYLEHVETAARVASAPVSCEPAPIASKAALVSALKKAVDLELTIMLQYLYAGYAIPNYAQGQQRVAQGQWSEAQLGLACGGGERRRDGGIRGTLMEVAHEEMIHYLVVNNLLMALGEPFYPGQVRLGQQAQDYFGLDTEFAFEAFSAHVLARFVRYEWPSFIPAPGDTIGSFYRSIRQAFVSLSGLFDPLERKRGGEHHLFLNELTNRAFPAYQLEVFDTASALFAIDFVTDQGEGCALQSPHFIVVPNSETMI